MINESVVNEILAKREEERRQNEIIVKNKEEYSRALNGIFSTEDGALFYKYLVKICKIYTIGEYASPVTELEERGRRRLFLEYIRKYLNKDLLIKLESEINE